MYIIGSVIGGRVSYSTVDEYDSLDGELVCRWVARWFACCFNDINGLSWNQNYRDHFGQSQEKAVNQSKLEVDARSGMQARENIRGVTIGFGFAYFLLAEKVAREFYLTNR